MRLDKEGITLLFYAKLSTQILVKWPVLRRSRYVFIGPPTSVDFVDLAAFKLKITYVGLY